MTHLDRFYQIEFVVGKLERHQYIDFIVRGGVLLSAKSYPHRTFCLICVTTFLSAFERIIEHVCYRSSTGALIVASSRTKSCGAELMSQYLATNLDH